MYEGAPNHPDEGRFWEIIEKYKVSIYTAPTAIRAFMKWGMIGYRVRYCPPTRHGWRTDQPRSLDLVSQDDR